MARLEDLLSAERARNRALVEKMEKQQASISPRYPNFQSHLILFQDDSSSPPSANASRFEDASLNESALSSSNTAPNNGGSSSSSSSYAYLSRMLEEERKKGADAQKQIRVSAN